MDRDEAPAIIVWPKALDYEIKGEIIRPKGWKADRYAPLLESDLFLTFARLHAHGEASEGRIVNWVRKHGLLRRAVPTSADDRLEEDVSLVVGRESVSLREYDLNQAPMRLEEFRAEVRQAHSCLTLLESIRSRDTGRLRSRITFKRVPTAGPEQLAAEVVALDGEPIPYCGGPPPELTDEFLLVMAVCCLNRIVESKMKDIRLAFTPDFKHPRPFSTYRPRLVASCPDLYSALYYQLASLIEDKRPWMNCVVCGLPVPRTRSHRETCGDACRKEKSRRNKADIESSG